MGTTAVYAIDKKRKKGQSEDSLQPAKLVPVAQALARLFPTGHRREVREGPPELAAQADYLRRFLADPEVRSATPSSDELDALWGLVGRQNMMPSESLSLFFHWGGGEWLLGRVLGRGRYGWNQGKQTLDVDAAPLTSWSLVYALRFLLDHAPSLGATLVTAVKEAKLPLTDRSRAASLLDDGAWASELVDEWLGRTMSRGEAWENCGLLGLIDDPARFERYVAWYGPQIRFLARNARLGRALDRLPAATIEKVVVELLDRGLKEKWKASEVEGWAKLLTHVKSAEAARALAQWVGEKSIAKLATDYFRVHPELAAEALGPVAKAKGKAGPIAKALLESLARGAGVASGEMASAEPTDEDARSSKTSKKATKGGAKASRSIAKGKEPSASASPTKASVTLPPVLLDPPWLSKTARARPRLSLEPIVEDERFDVIERPNMPRPQADRSPEKDARFLANGPPSKVYEGSIFQLTDAVALEAVTTRETINAWYLDALLVWLGPSVLPVAIRSIAKHLQYAHAYLLRVSSPRLALPCARLALKRTGGAERIACRAWLNANPDVAALGLVPAALGEDELDADVASQSLRNLAKAGHGEAVRRAAARYGEAAARAIDEVLSASPYDRYPAKLQAKAKWSLPAHVGTLALEGGGQLTEEQGTTLIQMLQLSPIGETYPGATETIALATKASREALAKALFAEYLLAGSPPSHAWVLGALAALAPEACIPWIGGQMRAWAADGKVALLHDSLATLAAIGSDEALVVVYDAGQRSRYDDTRDKVREILEGVARERGVSYEVLEDMLVPELGLESGAVTLSLGARTLSVRLGDHLEAVLTDDEGNALASFPRKGKKDEAAAYDAAKARYAALLDASEAVGKGQILRLERALRAQRSWSVAELRTLVVPQPLVRHLARRLVWQVVGAGTLFRIAEDLSLADAEDAPLAWPADEARVVLAHPVIAPELRSFQRWIDDYQVIQPFAQVGREVFTLTAEERDGHRVERAVGRKVTYLSVLALTLGMGWKPIPPGDKGIDAITRELTATDGTTRIARLAISPGLLFGAAKGRPEQTLGALTLETESREPAPLASLDALTLSELIRDAVTLS